MLSSLLSLLLLVFDLMIVLQLLQGLINSKPLNRKLHLLSYLYLLSRTYSNLSSSPLKLCSLSAGILLSVLLSLSTHLMKLWLPSSHSSWDQRTIIFRLCSMLSSQDLSIWLLSLDLPWLLLLLFCGLSGQSFQRWLCTCLQHFEFLPPCGFCCLDSNYWCFYFLYVSSLQFNV